MAEQFNVQNEFFEARAADPKLTFFFTFSEFFAIFGHSEFRPRTIHYFPPLLYILSICFCAQDPAQSMTSSLAAL